MCEKLTSEWMEKRHPDIYITKSHWRKAVEIRCLDYSGSNVGKCYTNACHNWEEKGRALRVLWKGGNGSLGC
jgi:hypothetical protein